VSASSPADPAPRAKVPVAAQPPGSLARDVAEVRGVVDPSQNGVGPPAYAGIVTRTIAFAIDVAIVEAVAALVAVTIGLGLSLLSISSLLETIVGAVLAFLWVVWSLGYFVFFWSGTGQTPGNRVMGIRVLDAKGRGPLKPRRAALRFAGLILAAIPLFAGYLMMLWDERSRCFQDLLARTVVIYTVAGNQPTSAVGRDLAARPPASPTGG
jgi:uncharacterized RDD family membrane protein YckC